MYLRILKKDLKRKKSMNIILLIFIILAATFIASSANNVVTVTTAVDGYFEKANVPDYWFATIDESHLEKYEKYAKKNDNNYDVSEMVIVNGKDVFVEGKVLEYANTLLLSGLEDELIIFDENDKAMENINDGELWMCASMFNSRECEVGDIVKVTTDGVTKEFVLKGCVKDAIMGPDQIGVSRFLISDNDLESFKTDNAMKVYSVNVYDIQDSFKQDFLDLELSTLFNVDKATIKFCYAYDMIIAGIMLVVSVCLVLISMVILRFTINFTMSEEFREIGVMKAIGLRCSNIRLLYIVKYLVIAVVGAIIGFALSIPFGNMLMAEVSQNVIISAGSSVILNAICAALTAGIVVLFCYMCTGKIKYFSSIDAIRNGENGERFRRKSIITLGKSKFKPAVFMALNDILSDVRRYVAMIVIFALGLLLIIIPANSINTLGSDRIIEWFNMARCDHAVAINVVSISATKDNKKALMAQIDNVEKLLKKNDIEADVFQENMFRATVLFNGKKASSGAFISIGKITTSDYVYLEGTAPQSKGEVALTKMTADAVGAHIGDTIEITLGEETKKYTVTAFYQSMTNMGEGVRFYQEEELDYKYISGYMCIQIKYTDNPTKEELADRKKLLEQIEDSEVFTSGEYINAMIGDISTTLGAVKNLILIVVIAINVLVTVLMVKSFITKEKGQIAMLKATGFNNMTIIVWQTLRIGVVLIISSVVAVLLSTPLSQLTCGPIFKMMGAHSIEFAIKPLEVFVFYPVLILCVTSLSALLASLQVRLIKASDTANIE